MKDLNLKDKDLEISIKNINEIYKSMKKVLISSFGVCEWEKKYSKLKKTELLKKRLVNKHLKENLRGELYAALKQSIHIYENRI